MKTQYRDCGVNGLTFTLPSLTRSEFAVDCDLKTIIRRFMTTGVLPSMVESFDGDVTNMPDDFTELQNLKVNVEQRFSQLPVEEQEKFESAEDWYLSSLQDVNVQESDTTVQESDTTVQNSDTTVQNSDTSEGVDHG